MTARNITPPWKFLREASDRALESYELSRLNHAANLKREIAALLDQWIEDNSEALLARWMRARSKSEVNPSEVISQPDLPLSDSSASIVQPARSNRVLRLPRRDSPL